MIDAVFSQPQRQNGFAILVYWFDYMKQFFLRGVYGLIPLIIDPGIWWLILILLILAVFATGFAALLAYYHFEFYLTDEELVIEQGLFNKQGANIPFERIQTVHLHQNVLQKLLGVKGVKVETAGSQQQETEIRGLSETYAQQLKNALKASAPGVNEKQQVADNESNVSNQPLVDLSLKDLSLIALTDNHFRNGGVILAFVFGTVVQFYPEASFANLINQISFTPFLTDSFWMQVIYGGALFIAIVLLVAFARHFQLYFNFKAQLTEEGFQTQGGLLRRNEYTVPFAKIQSLRWDTNFIRWPLRMQTITIHPAQSAAGESLSNVTIPGCFNEASKAVMDAVYPGFQAENPGRVIHPRNFYKIILLIKRLLIGSMVAFIGTYFYEYMWILGLFGVYAAFQSIAVARYVDSIALEVFNQGIIYRRGWLFPAATVFQAHKIQSVQIKQNYLQQRFGTCALIIGTAAGDFHIPYLFKPHVMPVYDWLLYKTETYKGSWM